MEKSIAQIVGNCAEELQGIFCKGLSNGSFAELNAEAFNSAKKLARDMVEYFLAETDRILRDEPERKERYVIERNRQTRTMQTDYGELKIERTLYQSKEMCSYHFLTDEVLGIDKYERIEDNLKVKLLGAAGDTSYGKASKLTGGVVSRQTVKNLVHKLEGIKALPAAKRTVDNIYIEADEDHIHMQDGKSRILKLIYVHEGTQEVSKGRKKLLNPWYFTSIEKESEDLWYEVMDYIESVYDSNSTITLRGDGGWIKGGLGYFPKAKFELDTFHMFKSITRATGHCRRLRGLIIDSIKNNDYERTHRLYEQLYAEAQKDSDRKETRESMTYILNHYDDIAAFGRGGGCSAEGHVSHMLSARLSSRPMGWSKRGAANIAGLRAFTHNGGNMFALIKHKKQPALLQHIPVKKIKRKLQDLKACSLPILAASSKHTMRFLVKKFVTYGNQNSRHDTGFL